MLESEENDPGNNICALAYHIINPQKNFGEGDINSIRNREKGYWKALIGTGKTYIRCGLDDYCRVFSMQARFADVHMLEIYGYENEKFLFEEMKLVSQKQRMGQQILRHQFKNKDEVVDEIEFEITSFSKKPFGIYFITFYGLIYKKKPPKPKPEPIKNAIAKIILKDRQRIEEQNKHIDEIIGQLAVSKFNHPKIQNNNTENKQVKQVKVTIKDIGNANEPLLIKSGVQEEELVKELELDNYVEGKEASSYGLLQVDAQELKIFQNVSDQWLEKQKKFQFQAKVKIEHQLSVRIHPKCFIGKIFCIANIYGSEKDKCVKLIREMGGVAHDSPSQGCILVSNSLKGSTVGIAKLMNDIIFVNPRYLEDCNLAKSQLQVEKYKIA